jgi:hypothetical protein
MSTSVRSTQRYTREHPCPICGGCDRDPRGQGIRCSGFLSEDDRFAFCTREEHAGSLPLRETQPPSYMHLLSGPCHCGETHGEQSHTASGNRFRGQLGTGESDTPPRCVVCEREWEIRDTSGCVRAVHVRKDYDNGDKDLWWQKQDGTWGLGGFAVSDLPPYGTHEWRPDRPTIHVEGEPARDALAPLADALGVNVVGHVTGAPATHSVDALRPILSPRHFLWPDSDDVGETQMERTHWTLRELLRDESGLPMRQSKDAIRRIAWEGARATKGDDAADFVAQGETAEDLVRLLSSAQPFYSAAPTVDVAAERIFPFRSASEIATATLEEPPFIAKPWLAEGALTEIDGKIKSAGKTTFATHMCRAILDGSDFLGEPTRRSPIVYLSEQSAATFREALRRAHLLDRDDFRVLFWQDTIGAKWPDVVRAARDEAARIGAKVLAVDTLAQFTGLRGDAENNAGAALEAVAPLQEAAAVDSLGVVILRHERKGGGDVGDSGRGSSAFAGAVDVVLRLRRPEGVVRSGVRVLDALSRFDQTPDTLVIELTEAGYVALGDTEAVAANEARVSILKAAPTSEAEALREADLLSAADVKRTVGQEAIREHLKAGRLNRIGAGKRNDAYRYWRPPDEDETDSAAAKDSTAASVAYTGAPALESEMLSAEAPGVPAESNDHHSDADAIHSAAPMVGVPAESIFSGNSTARDVQPEDHDRSMHAAGTTSPGAAEPNGAAGDPWADGARVALFRVAQ